MKHYKSIYELDDLTSDEEEFALRNAGIETLRYSLFKAKKITLWEKILSVCARRFYENRRWNELMKCEKCRMTKEEYFVATTQQKRYKHLFFIFRGRGNFSLAREYDFVKEFETI